MTIKTLLLAVVLALAGAAAAQTTEPTVAQATAQTETAELSADSLSAAALPAADSGRLAHIESRLAQLATRVEPLLSRVRVNGYAQAAYTYSDTEPTESTLELKRTLLWVTATLTDRWSCRFMHDFSSEVQEFYTDYRVTRGQQLTVRLGQFKNSYSMENPLSPTQMELIDVYSQAVTYLAGCGSDPLYGVSYGRDLGIMIFGSVLHDRVRYELALMNGQGINCSDGNSDKDIIVKVDWRPLAGLRLVASGQKGRGHAVGTAPWNTAIAVGDNYRRDRVSLGGEWCRERLAVHGEWLWGQDGSVVSRGAYVTGRYTVRRALDVVGSVDFFDKNTGGSYNQTNVTAGVQYWFLGKCRLQLQYTRVFSQYQADYHCVQSQVQVAF